MCTSIDWKHQANVSVLLMCLTAAVTTQCYCCSRIDLVQHDFFSLLSLLCAVWRSTCNQQGTDWTHFSTSSGRSATMLCVWEGNRRFCVALAMRQRHRGIPVHCSMAYERQINRTSRYRLPSLHLSVCLLRTFTLNLPLTAHINDLVLINIATRMIE